MPNQLQIMRYFFDTFDGELWICDEEGIECIDLDDARTRAQAALPDMAKDELPDSSERIMTVRVRDAEGLVMETSLVLSTVLLRRSSAGSLPLV